MATGLSELACKSLIKRVSEELHAVDGQGAKGSISDLVKLTEILERATKLREPVLTARRKRMRQRRDAARKVKAEEEAARARAAAAAGAAAPVIAPAPPVEAEASEGDDRFDEGVEDE